MPGPREVNIARVVALRLGCDNQVPAWTVQRNCASGLQAVDCAAQDIATRRPLRARAGWRRTEVDESCASAVWQCHGYLAGHNQCPGATTADKVKTLPAFRPVFLKPVIGLLRGFTDPIVGLNMGQTAEVLAHRFAITREQMDSYALRSHQRLGQAQENGHLEEIEVIYDHQGKFYDADDGLRAG